MNELGEKLADCFQAVFPQISRNDIQGTSMKLTEDWDSMATITLVSLIEESFGIETQPDDIEHLTSFESILRYLQGKAVVAEAS